MIINIHVTQDHIDLGQPGEGDSCALALAVEEQFPDAVEIEINSPVMKFRLRDGTLYTAQTPEEVADFISEYDEEVFDEGGDEYEYPGKESVSPQVFMVDFNVTLPEVPGAP